MADCLSTGAIIGRYNPPWEITSPTSHQPDVLADPVSRAHGTCRYTVEAVLGRGSQGTVYKARDGSGNSVVLKCVRMAADHGKDDAKALQEVRILQSLHHENIVCYFDSFKHNGFLVISMYAPLQLHCSVLLCLLKWYLLTAFVDQGAVC
jgi:serine/threonine protein kinase